MRCFMGLSTRQVGSPHPPPPPLPPFRHGSRVQETPKHSRELNIIYSCLSLNKKVKYSGPNSKPAYASDRATTSYTHDEMRKHAARAIVILDRPKVR